MSKINDFYSAIHDQGDATVEGFKHGYAAPPAGQEENYTAKIGLDDNEDGFVGFYLIFGGVFFVLF